MTGEQNETSNSTTANNKDDSQKSRQLMAIVWLCVLAGVITAVALSVAPTEDELPKEAKTTTQVDETAESEDLPPLNMTQITPGTEPIQIVKEPKKRDPIVIPKDEAGLLSTLEEAKKNHSTHRELDTYKRLGLYYASSEINKLEKAEEYFTTGLERATLFNSRGLIYQFHLHLIRLNTKLEDFEDTKKYLDATLTIPNIGADLEYYLLAVRVSEKMNDSAKACGYINNLRTYLPETDCAQYEADIPSVKANNPSRVQELQQSGNLAIIMRCIKAPEVSAEIDRIQSENNCSPQANTAS